MAEDSVRSRWEAWEEQTLSPYATLSKNTRGRAREIEPCEIRTCFMRDRDRILHCKAFRRLKHKTQVFLAPLGDHYRTRLTHTLEVSQIARTIARAMRLNEDLTEAIALGHDLGHTPFGHAGEDALRQCFSPDFAHAEQSIRVVERLENDGKGLNLTVEVRDGILHHNGKGIPFTLEGQVVKTADRIAYINHDIDDAIRGGILKPFELPRRCLSVLGRSHGERINTMIADIVRESRNQPFVCMSPEVAEASDELRSFLFANVYHDSWRAREEEKCDYVVSGLFDHYSRHPEQLPAEYLEICYTEGAERAVCDFVGCMTDRYAIDRYTEVYIPGAFGSY